MTYFSFTGVEFIDAEGYSVPIYPERIKTLLELSPGQDRLTLSLFFQIDSKVTNNCCWFWISNWRAPCNDVLSLLNMFCLNVLQDVIWS